MAARAGALALVLMACHSPASVRPASDPIAARGVDDFDTVLSTQLPATGEAVPPPAPFTALSPTTVSDGTTTYELSAPLAEWDVLKGPRLTMRFPASWEMSNGATLWGCSGALHRCVFSSVRALGNAVAWIEAHKDSVGAVVRAKTADGDETVTYRDAESTHILRWHGAHMFRLSYQAQTPPNDFFIVIHTMQWSP